jgi:phosphoribosylamine--glycine ligase
VLNAVGIAETVAEAARLSREAAEAVEFEGKVFRRDIGWREIERRAGRP